MELTEPEEVIKRLYDNLSKDIEFYSKMDRWDVKMYIDDEVK